MDVAFAPVCKLHDLRSSDLLDFVLDVASYEARVRLKDKPGGVASEGHCGSRDPL